LRIKTIGNLLVTAGALLGVATVAAIAAGIEIRLTPEMIQLLTYKALGAAAIGLIIVGTWIGRGGTKRNSDPGQSINGGSNHLHEGGANAELPDDASVKMNARAGEIKNVEH
jgi:hypothetical protein